MSSTSTPTTPTSGITASAQDVTDSAAMVAASSMKAARALETAANRLELIGLLARGVQPDDAIDVAYFMDLLSENLECKLSSATSAAPVPSEENRFQLVLLLVENAKSIDAEADSRILALAGALIGAELSRDA